MMLFTSTLLFLIASGHFLLSVQGLTLRLKGKEMIPDGGEVKITDLPVGGCRRYDTLECLSDMPYRGRLPNAYWVYTDPQNNQPRRVDTIRCKGDRCTNPDIGWLSSRGIYRRGRRYYNVIRLGRQFKNATGGEFKCYFKGKESPVTVNIKCNELRINITPYHDNSTTISWDEPCGGADNYTVFLNETVNGGCTYKERNETFYAIPKGAVVHLQVVALRKNAAPICFPVYSMITKRPVNRTECFYNEMNCTETDL